MAPAIPHLNYSSPYTSLILTIVAVTSMLSIPLVQLIPLRAAFLVIGLAPFFVTHPCTRFTLIPLVNQVISSHVKRTRVRFARLVDNDRLEDKHWRSELKEVYLWENERWAGVAGSEDDGITEAGWSKSNLRPTERRGWTRGRDGWSGVSDDGSGDVRSVSLRSSCQCSILSILSDDVRLHAAATSPFPWLLAGSSLKRKTGDPIWKGHG